MTVVEYNSKIWSYYLLLEYEFNKTLNYVEFTEDNFSTYSNEYVKLLLSICSEVDVVFKKICEIIATGQPRNCITEYAKILCNYHDFTNAKVLFSYNREEYCPFVGWTDTNSPIWWKEYNCVKHHRMDSDNYKKANLQNVFISLAGLYVLNRYLCKEIFNCEEWMKEPEVKSKLFSMVGWDSSLSMGNGLNIKVRASGGMDIVSK